ncbi:MAG: NUDIX hydrolase [Planctomycetota bacterium]
MRERSSSPSPETGARPGQDPEADARVRGRLLGGQTVYEGRKFDLEVVTLRIDDGTEARREILRHPGAVTVLPLLDGPEGPETVLVLNERDATGRELLEFCAGTIDPGEPPDVCAGRELTEETGLIASQLRPVGAFYTSPGMTDELMHCYVAIGNTQGELALDDGERLRPLRMRVSDVWRAIDEGALVDGKSLAALTLAWRRGLFPGPNGADEARG